MRRAGAVLAPLLAVVLVGCGSPELSDRRISSNPAGDRGRDARLLARK